MGACYHGQGLKEYETTVVEPTRTSMLRGTLNNQKFPADRSPQLQTWLLCREPTTENICGPWPFLGATGLYIL